METATEDKAKQKAANEGKLLRLFLNCVALFLSTMLGIAIAASAYTQTATVYESQGTFQLTFGKVDPAFDGVDILSVRDVRHDQLFAQHRFVEECLSENRLQRLRAFEDIAEDKIVQRVCENLSVTQNKEEPSIYKVVYRCSRPDDCQVVLNNLIASYKNNLDEQEEQVCREYAMKLKVVYDRFKAMKDQGITLPESSESEFHDAKMKLTEFDRFGMSPDSARLIFLQDATQGEPIWPILPVYLLIGAAVGFAVGFFFVLSWFFLRAFS